MVIATKTAACARATFEAAERKNTDVDGKASEEGTVEENGVGETAGSSDDAVDGTENVTDEPKKKEEKKTDWSFTDEEFEKIRTVANHSDKK